MGGGGASGDPPSSAVSKMSKKKSDMDRVKRTLGKIPRVSAYINRGFTV